MRVPYTPVFSVPNGWAAPDMIAEIQANINKYYAGVECETVTEKGRLGNVHVSKLYVDGIEVFSGLQGLVEAMKNRLGT